MTSALIILSVIVFLLAISQLVFVYFLLVKRGVIPEIVVPKREALATNEFTEATYSDLSDITVEDGLKGIKDLLKK